MKKIIITLGVLLMLVINIFAQQTQDNSLKIYGELRTDQRVLYKDGQWAWNENRLTLDLEKTIRSNAKFYSEIWLRNIGLPQYYSLADLYNKNITDPWNLEIRQAYVTVYGLLNGKLDFTAGKQIFSWGTADRFNPTNNLSPYDFEDVLDFGRKRGVIALKADYYFNSDNYLEVALVPIFKPASMPIGIFSNILANQNMDLPDNVTLTTTTDSLYLPDYKVQNMTAGLRFKGFLAGFDYSLSYVYGFDQLPVPYSSQMNLYVSSLSPLTFNATMHTNLDFYRQHIFGFDMAGNLGGVGVWAEAALFVPTKDIDWQIVTNYPVITQIPPQTVDSTLFAKNKPYVKYVLGADYTFGNGVYVNAQFIHGFLHERWQGNLNDYLFLRMEKSFFNDKLKLAPVTAAIMVSDWNDVKNNYAIGYFPQITYKPTDNFELTLASGLFTGKGEGLFANLQDYNMFILGVKYSF